MSEEELVFDAIMYRTSHHVAYGLEGAVGEETM